MSLIEKEFLNNLCTACLQAFFSDDFHDKSKAVNMLERIKRELSTLSTSSTNTIIISKKK